MDLTEFAETQSSDDGRKRRRCMTCALPDDVLTEVTKGRTQAKPISYEIISKWLKATYEREIHANTIRNHFVNGHHNE